MGFGHFFMNRTFKKIVVYLLRIESKLVLWKYKPKVVAITGSMGKTSTKDAVYAVLSTLAHVRKSEKSYNSEIGLPLTILGVPNGWNSPVIWANNFLHGLKLILLPAKYPKWLVLEVGVGKPGDMEKTASWLSSDVVILTAIGHTPPHIEFFSSRERLIEEKSGLIDTLKEGGLLVANADDDAIMDMRRAARGRSITFGFGPAAEIRASGEDIFYDSDNLPRGMAYRVEKPGESRPVVIEGVFGRSHIYATLAAIAMASGLEFSVLGAVQALKNYDVPPGRMRLLAGINGSLIIDDTYNSSPAACESALRTLDEIKGRRKIAVLGDMLELGKHTVEAHKNIGYIASEKADFLIVVGPRAESIREGALSNNMDSKKIFAFANSGEAGEFLKTFVKKGDLILIKGSQSVRMERAVAAILLDQTSKKKLLVRQDEEWLNKK